MMQVADNDNSLNRIGTVGLRAFLVAFLMFAAVFCLPAWSAELAPPLKQWLVRAGAERVGLAIDVRPLDGGEPLYSRQSNHSMNPASVIKLATVGAALGILGSDYRWRTRLFAGGPIRAGHLEGDLIVVGGGDPKLVIEDLTELIVQLRAEGLHDIRGDLILDDSLYRVPERRVVFDGQVSEPYNVRPNAAMMNFKATKFTLRPRGARVQVELDPSLAGVAIDNQLSLVKGRCRYRASGIKIVEPGTDAQPVIRLQGKYSRACKTQSAYHAVLTHRQFIEAFFRAAWEAAGGRWFGHARFDSQALIELGEDATPFYTWISPRPMAQIAADINKFSNNVMTRQLLLHLATVGQRRGVTREQGLAAVRAWLSAQQIPMHGWVIDNGSGLSRKTRANAAGLSRLLVHMAGGPFRGVFRDSLPVVGIDGTMRWRLAKEPIAGQAWIKTGSLDGVRSIAGYVRARSGREYAVTMLANGRAARRTLKVQDQLLRWVYETG